MPIVHEVFEAICRDHSDKTAVGFKGSTLTYAQLNARVNQVARALHSHLINSKNRASFLNAPQETLPERPLLHATLPNADLVTFAEEIILGDGNCGFTTIGASREQVADKLIALAEYEEVRDYLSQEIQQALVILAFRTKEGSILLEKRYQAQQAFDGLFRETLEKFPGWRHESGQGQNEQIQSFIAWLKEEEKTERKDLEAQHASLTQAEKNLIIYCQREDVYRSYIEALRGNLWLGYHSALLYAKHSGFSLYLWRKKSNNSNQLELMHVHQEPEARQVIHMLHTGGYNHFNLLVINTTLKQDYTPNLQKHLVNTPPLDNTGPIVGVYIEPSPEAIVALIAVFKGGMTYHPLSTNEKKYPKERLRAQLINPNITTILSTEKALLKNPWAKALFDELNIQLIDIEKIKNDINTKKLAAEETFWPQEATDEQKKGWLAYIIGTSGSTGAPKKVMVNHSGLVAVGKDIFSFISHHLESKENIEHCVAQLAGDEFDARFQEILTALLTGQRLQIVPEEIRQDAAGLTAYFNTYGVTIATFTPQLLEKLEPNQFTSLLALISTGSRALEPSMRAWRAAHPNFLFINGIGFTEVSIASKLAICRNSIHLGSLTGTKLETGYIGDNQFSLKPHGTIEGTLELYVQGNDCLARRYTDPELTERVFTTAENTRHYRTGDLGNDKNNILTIEARASRAVKVYGEYVHPGEIETALQESCGLQSHVNPHCNARGNPQFGAYIFTPHNLSLLEIYQRLSERLPLMMIPSRWWYIAKKPLKENDKQNLDEERLFDNLRNTPPEFVREPSVNSGLRDEYERKIADLWQDLLDLPRDMALNPSDHFLFLGGTSIILMQLLEEITKNYKIKISPNDFLVNPTLENIAMLVRTKTNPNKNQMQIIRLLKGEAEEKPIFYIHSLVGDSEKDYRNIIPYLSTLQRTFYGITAPSLTDPSLMPRIIEAIAALYIKAIQEIQLLGPYTLVSYSAGGAIVYEMAQQLKKYGHQASVICIGFETRFSLSTIPEKTFSTVLKDTLEFLAPLATPRPPNELIEFKSNPEESKSRQLELSFSRLRDRKDNLFATAEIIIGALLKYRPQAGVQIYVIDPDPAQKNLGGITPSEINALAPPWLEGSLLSKVIIQGADHFSLTKDSSSNGHAKETAEALHGLIRKIKFANTFNELKASLIKKYNQAAEVPLLFQQAHTQYTPLLITKHSSEGSSALEQPRNKKNTDHISLEELLTKINPETNQVPRRVLLTGVAGSGKSTTIDHIVNETLQGRLWKKRNFKWVFCVRPRELVNKPPNNSNITTWEAILGMSSLEGNATQPQLFSQMIEEEKEDVLLVVDGLDEIQLEPTQNSGIVDHIKTLLAWPNLIITGRPHVTLPKNIKIDAHYQLNGFDDHSINDYINNYFRSIGKAPQGQSLLEHINDNLLSREILYVPIVLSLVCFSWSQPVPFRTNLATTRTRLYQDCWNMSSMIYWDTYGNETLNTEQAILEKSKAILAFLGKIAYENITSKKPSPTFSGKTLVRDLGDQKDLLLNAIRHGWLRVVSSTEIPNRLLLDKYNYKPPHQTFSEFCAAHHIVKSLITDKNKTLTTIEECNLSKDSMMLQFASGLIAENHPEYLSEFLDSILLENRAENSLIHWPFMQKRVQPIELTNSAPLNFLLRTSHGLNLGLHAIAYPIRFAQSLIFSSLEQLLGTFDISPHLIDHLHETGVIEPAIQAWINKRFISAFLGHMLLCVCIYQENNCSQFNSSLFRFFKLNPDILRKLYYRHLSAAALTPPPYYPTSFTKKFEGANEIILEATQCFKSTIAINHTLERLDAAGVTEPKLKKLASSQDFELFLASAEKEEMKESHIQNHSKRLLQFLYLCTLKKEFLTDDNTARILNLIAKTAHLLAQRISKFITLLLEHASLNSKILLDLLENLATHKENVQFRHATIRALLSLPKLQNMQEHLALKNNLEKVESLQKDIGNNSATLFAKTIPKADTDPASTIKSTSVPT